MKAQTTIIAALERHYLNARNKRDLSGHYSANEGCIMAERAKKILLTFKAQTEQEREKVERCIQQLDWAIKTASESYSNPHPLGWIIYPHPVIQVERALEIFLYC